MKKSKKARPLRLGVVGGGQLAQMLALEAIPRGLEVHVLCTNSDEPAAQLTSHWHQGNPHDPKILKKFSQQVDIVTFESEFFDARILENRDTKSFIAPSPKALRLLQDRRTQKQLLVDFKIPTSPFLSFDQLPSEEKFKDVAQFYNHQLVWKLAMGGYDGKGTFFVGQKKDAAKIFSQLRQHHNKNAFIAEAAIPFRRELALMCARSYSGEFITFPLVETFQKQGRCDWVLGPVQHAKLSPLVKKIERLLHHLQYVGVIGFELFDTGKELWVNELAPRPHNSGHYSQDALSESQFLVHLKCLLGLPLQKPQLLGASFCMTNLIGASSRPVKFPKSLRGQLHWYNKSENRPGRKMGHVNYLSESKNQKQLLSHALRERKGFHL